MIALYILLGILGICALYITFMVIVSYTIKPKDYDEFSKFHKAVLIVNTYFCKFFCRIKLKVVNKELMKQLDSKFLLVSNHLSNFDPIVAYHVLKEYDIGFISKFENFKIFCAGRLIRKLCCRSINRFSLRQSLLTLKDAARLIRNDVCSFGVYPEGARNFTDDTLLHFHDGTLKIAKEAHVPIVVSYLKGTDTIAKNFPLRRSHVEMGFLKIIPKEEVDAKTTHELSREIQDLLLKELKKEDA